MLLFCFHTDKSNKKFGLVLTKTYHENPPFLILSAKLVKQRLVEKKKARQEMLSKRFIEKNSKTGNASSNTNLYSSISLIYKAIKIRKQHHQTDLIGTTTYFRTFCPCWFHFFLFSILNVLSSGINMIVRKNRS